MKKLKPLFVILTAALILFSAVCFLYPAISNAINEQYNESRIDDYNNNVDSISQEDIDDYFSVAEKYNKALATDVSTDDSSMSILSHYDEILDLDDGVMGYVEIPSINVRLPIYHGESEDILEKGAAHLEHAVKLILGGISAERNRNDRIRRGFRGYHHRCDPDGNNLRGAFRLRQNHEQNKILHRARAQGICRHEGQGETKI